jgi:hypothetical protein
MRVQEGLKIEANFVGLRELTLQEATFDPDTRETVVAHIGRHLRDAGAN